MDAAEFNATYPCTRDGVELLKLSLGLVVYGHFEPCLDGVIRVVEAAWPALEAHVASYQTTNMRKPRKAGGKGKDVLLQALHDPSPVLSIVMVDNRTHIDQAPDVGVELSMAGYRKAGYLLFRFRPDDTAPGTLLALCQMIASEMAFTHGYAGFTLAYNRLSLKASLPERTFYPIGMKHPGVDLPSANNTSFVAEKCIKRVNWLTLVGSDLAAQTEGLSALAEAAHVVVHTHEYGVVVQAGETPQIGNVNRRERCEPYRVVAKALQDIRCQNHPAFIVDDSGVFASSERTDTWLASLDS